jgi:hypothetical protein
MQVGDAIDDRHQDDSNNVYLTLRSIWDEDEREITGPILQLANPAPDRLYFNYKAALTVWTDRSSVDPVPAPQSGWLKSRQLADHHPYRGGAPRPSSVL